ncbi:MAG TPA: PPC domain-containing protein [Candidatus Thermoplasmatota archaeon]|nr:PPC domain-containing protein [Candidatus Thermoplasmatota archaeon]
MRLKTIILVLLMLHATAFTAMAIGEWSRTNDAGSGADAGNTQGTAYKLPAFGVYQGTSWPPRDVDWLRSPDMSSNVGTCIEYAAASRKPINATLVINTTTSGEIRANATPTRLSYVEDGKTYWYFRSHGGFAGFDANAAWLGLIPTPPTIDDDDSWGWWNFDLQQQTQSSLNPDGGTGSDAGNNFSDPTAINRGCVGGQLKLAQGDTRDVYYFTVDSARRIVLSFGASGDNAMLRIYNPERQAMTALGTGEALEVYLPSAGTYFIEAGRADLPALSPTDGTPVFTSPYGTSLNTAVSVDYIIGIINGPDKPRPTCRPACDMIS